MEAYTVPGWPSGLNGHAALMPGLTRTAGGGWEAYKDQTVGQPGTQAIPVTGPGIEQSRAGQAASGPSRTSDAPGEFRPNLYWARPQPSFRPGGGMPISRHSDNLMPVPARDPRGIPARLARPIVRRGNQQIKAQPSVVSWPAYTRPL